MAGTTAGGRKAALTNKQKYGADFYINVGRMGGKTPKTKPSGFAANRDLAREAGRKGGQKSRPKTEQHKARLSLAAKKYWNGKAKAI